MHTASPGFHYGPEVAASRHSLVWFRDLGGKSINGLAGATRSLNELFHNLWVPQDGCVFQLSASTVARSQ